MSARNVIFHFNGSLFCLHRSLFFSLSDFSAVPSSFSSCLFVASFSLSFSLLRVVVSLFFPPSRGFYRGPFIHGPRPHLPFFRDALLILAAVAAVAASSSYSCRLDSFLLSRRERLNSLRPFFAPTLLSCSFDFLRLPRDYLVATDRRRNRGDARRNSRIRVWNLTFGHVSHVATKNAKYTQ